MNYWTISFPGEFGQHVTETWTEDQIIESYYAYWLKKMIENGHYDKVSRASCIDDWCVVHWAVKTDKFGK